MNSNYETFEGDPNNAVVYNAWIKWRDQFIAAGKASVSHPDPAYRRHATEWFKNSASMRDPDQHVREGARYFFIKGQTS
jgi:hypothetical protein